MRQTLVRAQIFEEPEISHFKHSKERRNVVMLEKLSFIEIKNPKIHFFFQISLSVLQNCSQFVFHQNEAELSPVKLWA